MSSTPTPRADGASFALKADATYVPAGALANVTSSGGFQQLYSENGAYLLTMQADGNLVEYNHKTPVWSTQTWGKGAAVVNLQADGSLVVSQVNAQGQPTTAIYNSGTSGKGVAPYALTLQNNGNLVIYDATSTEIWSNSVGDSSFDIPLVAPKAAVTSTGTVVNKLKSPNLLYSLTMQTDGNLVLMKQNTPIWNTATYNRGTGPYRATMQTDGNFVVYDKNNSFLWNSATYNQGVPPYQLVLNNYGNLYIKDSLGHRLWSALGLAGTANLTGATWSPPVPSTIANSNAQGKCLDAGSGSNGVQSHLWTCGDSSATFNQTWLYTLDQQLQIATDTGRCLTFETNNIVDTQPCAGTNNQRWVFNAADGAYGTIQPLKSSGLCLDTLSYGKDNNTPIQIYTCTGATNQLWVKNPTGGGVFNPNLPWWPNASYTDGNTLAAQRSAWAQVVANLTAALKAGAISYTIPAGTYHTGGVAAYFTNTSNFTLNAAGVELIADNQDIGFYLSGNKNFVINGPMTFDAYPGSNGQGVLTQSDASTYISFNASAGSPVPPAAPSRIMLFNANGQMVDQDIFQYGCVSSTGGCGGGGGQYTLSNFTRFSGGAQYGEWGKNNVNAAAGNYVVTMGGSSGNLFQGYGDTSITVNDVAVYGGSLVNGLWTMNSTNLTLNHVTAPRRPGTNRLIGGLDLIFMYMNTGAINIFESDIAWDTDDVTDPFSQTMYAATDARQNVQANQIWATGWSTFANQDTVNIYDPNTLEVLYSGKLTQTTKNATNGEYLLSFATNLPNIPYQAILDDASAQPTVVYTDSYFHDAQSNGMQAQGGKLVQFTNNYVRNAAVSVTGSDVLWGPAGGGMPINVVVNNNTINKQMLYQTPIYIYCNSFNQGAITGKPMQSVTVLNNLMMTWQNSGPIVSQARSMNVSGNVVTSSLPNF